MENASKALIIAGAILISLLIVGLGVIIYNRVSGTASDTSAVDETKVEEQNQKFTSYFGNKNSAEKIKSLMSAIRNNNLTSANSDETKKVWVYFKQGTSYDKFLEPTKVSSAVKSGKTYTVKVEEETTYDGTDITHEPGNKTDGCYYVNGFIRIIYVEENP